MKERPMNTNSKIYVAGHRGLVGSALCRELRRQGFNNLVLRTPSELDLRDNRDTRIFFDWAQPEYVFVAAAKVGGIAANNENPVKFLRDNLEIQTNLLGAAAASRVKKLLFLGSSCIYPKLAQVPIKEESLLTGPLEPTNQWYAIAKIAGLKLCEAYRREGADFISAMPTNLYGPGDNYDPHSSHVLPALIRKFHDARANGDTGVTCWGSGAPLREFLYVDDLARACVLLMQEYSEASHINVGSGEEISIRDLALMVARVVGYKGSIRWDETKPDGTMRKMLDSSKLRAMGWAPLVALEDGIRTAYDRFCPLASDCDAPLLVRPE